MDRALKGAKVMQFPSVSNDILYGVPREVPNVVGMTEREASGRTQRGRIPLREG